MPITVVSPTPTVLGPGVGFIVRTDLVGPFATGTTWRFEIHPHGDETNVAVVMTAPLWSSDQHERRVWIDADPDGGQATFYGRYVSLNTNDLADLVMQLLAPDGVTVLDSGTTSSLRWDTSTSSSRLIPVTGGGLTPDQAGQLNDILQAVIRTFPAP